MNRSILAGAVIASLVIFCAFCFGVAGHRVQMSDVFTPDELRAYAALPKGGQTPEAVFRKRIEFLEGKLSRAQEPDHVAFIKLYLAGQCASLHDFDKAGRLLDEVRAMTNTSAHFQREDARVAEILLCNLQASAAETEPEFLQHWNKAASLGEELLKEFKQKGPEAQYLTRLNRSTQDAKTRCYSAEGRFLPFSERKRARDEALQKAREKRELEAKAAGGGSAASATLAAACASCGSTEASPKPAESSATDGGCGCASSQPAASTQPTAKLAGSSAGGTGCGCGSAAPQEAAR